MPGINRTGSNPPPAPNTQTTTTNRVFSTLGYRGDEARVIEEIRYHAEEAGKTGPKGSLSEEQLKAGIAGLRKFYAEDASVYVNAESHPTIAIAVKIEQELLHPKSLGEKAADGLKQAGEKVVSTVLGPVVDLFDSDGR
jgi:hypothetical protein